MTATLRTRRVFTAPNGWSLDYVIEPAWYGYVAVHPEGEQWAMDVLENLDPEDDGWPSDLRLTTLERLHMAMLDDDILPDA
jgi:hypothetical protein